jgi:hypothetical protein
MCHDETSHHWTSFFQKQPRHALRTWTCYNTAQGRNCLVMVPAGWNALMFWKRCPPGFKRTLSERVAYNRRPSMAPRLPDLTPLNFPPSRLYVKNIVTHSRIAMQRPRHITGQQYRSDVFHGVRPETIERESVARGIREL